MPTAVHDGKYICPHQYPKMGVFGYQPQRVCRDPRCKEQRRRVEQIINVHWIGFSSTKLMRNLHVLTEIAGSDMIYGMDRPAAIFCGDRNWDDWKAVNDVMAKLHPRLVIEGDARGADRIAGVQAAFLGIPFKEYPADWNRFGKGAGPVRNQQMLNRLLEEDEPRLVVAFHDDLKSSRGTKDMVNRAKRAGVPVKLVHHKKGRQ